ncbi:MAG TPA: transporter substrate-binding domain-containing protein [Cyclobacteriaceae bacterium]|nr:transporter substrate-binding domain-containing protein [Cyclobacteriaceae bacterium]
MNTTNWIRAFLLCWGVLGCMTSTCLGQNDSWADVQKRGSGTLTVIYYPQNRIIYEENGKVKGFFASILVDFADFVEKNYQKKIKINYEKPESQFKNFMNKVEVTPNVLGVGSVTITRERERRFKFTPLVMQTPLVLVTHKSVPAISDVGQLKFLNNHKALLLKGTNYLPTFSELKSKHLPNLEIITVNEVMAELKKNEQYFTIVDFTGFFDMTREFTSIKYHAFDLGQIDDIGFIMPLSSDWKEPWDKFLTKAYKQSSSYKKYILENLGSPYLKFIQQHAAL